MEGGRQGKGGCAERERERESELNTIEHSRLVH